MQYHRIYARIDIDAILHNLGECKRRIPEGTKVLAVIKADGYGHGAVELAHQLERVCRLTFPYACCQLQHSGCFYKNCEDNMIHLNLLRY